MKRKSQPVPNGKVIGNAEEIAQYTLPGYKYSSTWSSPESFARYIESKKRGEAWHQGGWEHDESWSGTKDMDTALKMVREGWKEGAEQVERLRERIEANTPQAPRLIKYTIAGVNPSIPRAVAGNLMNMRQPDMSRSRKRPVITLVSNMAANCGVPAHQITNRAAAVAAIIDKVESLGYSVEVISTATTKGGEYWIDDASAKSYTSAISVVVKKSDQPVDTVRLSYGLGHASMFRRLVFADWGTEPSAERGLGRGLGHECNMSLPKDDEFEVKGVYSLSSAEHKGQYFDTEERSMVDGLNHLMQELKDQGCPAFTKVDIPEPLPDEHWSNQPSKPLRLKRK